MGEASPKTEKLDANSLLPDVDDEEASWKRSKSDASFFLAGAASKGSNASGHTDNISEHSAVYWNIAEAVEESATLSTSRKFSPFGSRDRSHKPLSGTDKYDEVDMIKKPGHPFPLGVGRLKNVQEGLSEFSSSDATFARQSFPALSTQTSHALNPDITHRPRVDEWSGTTTSLYRYRDKQINRQTDYSFYSTGSSVRSSEDSQDDAESVHTPPVTAIGDAPTDTPLSPTTLTDLKKYLTVPLATLRYIQSAISKPGGLLEKTGKEKALKALNTCDEILCLADTKVSKDEAEPLMREMCSAVLGALQGFLNNEAGMSDESWTACRKQDVMGRKQTEATPPLAPNTIEDTQLQAQRIILVPRAQLHSSALPDHRSTSQMLYGTNRHLTLRFTQILNRILRIADVTDLSKEDVDEPVPRLQVRNVPEGQSESMHSINVSELTCLARSFRQHGICNSLLAGSRKSRSDDTLYAEFLAALEPLLQKMKELNLGRSGTLSELISELTFACRSKAVLTLRHAALNLVNLTVFGDVGAQLDVIVIWLSTLALHLDVVVQYFALLSTAFLLTKPELTTPVLNSGIVDRIRPFVRTHSPAEFARNNLIHAFLCVCRAQTSTAPTHCFHCYTKATRGWLQRLLPALSSPYSEVRILAAFHFLANASLNPAHPAAAVTATESELPLETGPNDAVMNEAFNKLYQIACSIDPLESELGFATLELCGKELPHRLTPHVPSWSASDVCFWLDRVGFKELSDLFIQMNIDGDVLLSLDDFHLQHGLNISNSITRLKFLQSLARLKLEADYSSIDHTNLAEWLLWAATLIPKCKRKKDTWSTKVSSGDQLELTFSSGKSHALRIGPSRNLRQYTHNLIAAGVDRMHLAQLTNDTLLNDCHIANGLHRAQILVGVQILQSGGVHSENAPTPDCSDRREISNRELDVFISYRRSTGDRLASLVRAHLLARNYTVFLDVLSMPAGKFTESIRAAIYNSNNYILVLTNGCLDRCRNDNKCQDWVHREIVWAMEYNCNIIPVFDGNFEWPNPEELPEDMRQIQTYHGITWRHDYQDAWVSELERLMKVQRSSRRRSDTTEIMSHRTTQ
ncbi:NAD(+) hydrolase sarm1 [Clonorchis sinensis]|uniref:NAD(+) hydrolase sarm1 n=1 Tax=Clonorchis sinensis TaxID=79923 RepID=A0A8T1MJ41_CLOSI|nr:NAD(+) hydrolase sarm1 [Clonorchis sinensis]